MNGPLPGAGSPSTYAQEMPFLTPGSFSPEMDNTIPVQDHPSILIRKDLGVQHPDYIYSLSRLSEAKSTVVHPGVPQAKPPLQSPSSSVSSLHIAVQLALLQK